MLVDARAKVSPGVALVDGPPVREKVVGDCATGAFRLFAVDEARTRLPLEDRIDELAALLAAYERGEANEDVLADYVAANAETKTSTKSEVDGHPATFWKSDGARSPGGLLYYERDGTNRVLKMTSPVGTGVVDYDFLREVLFGMCASLVGGPCLLSFGAVEHEGRKRLYVEMDEQFSGQPSITLKRAARKAPDEMKNEYLANPDVRARIVDNVARLFVRVTERGLVPKDPDFIISRDGDVAWLDPADWTFTTKPKETLAMLNYLASMTCRFGDLQRDIVASFKRQAFASPQIGAEARTTIVSMFRGR